MTQPGSSSSYAMPPHPRNEAGAWRGCGIEIEFADLDSAEAAEVVRAALGGTIRQEDEHRHIVEDSALGKVKVELDLRFAHPDDGNDAPLEKELKSTLGKVTKLVLPHEVITEPIPLNRLAEIDPLVAALRAAGASGTGASALYAFGVHLNPEVPRRDIDTITRITRAFTVANGWLRREVRPDTTRRMLRFAQPYAKAYRRLIAEPSYRPDLARFIDDYLEHNPSRNHDLDLLPLLAFLDGERVAAAIGDFHSGARPTFHYRLPNARLGDPDWSVADEWNRWVAIERLAADGPRLEAVARRYLETGAEDDPELLDAIDQAVTA